MAVETGLGWSVASRDNAAGCLQAIVACVFNVDLDITRNSQEIQGMDKSSMARLLLLGDYSSTWTLGVNKCTNKSLCVHKTATTSNVTRTETLTHSSQILTNEVLISAMQIARGSDGSLVMTAPAVLQSGTDPTWST